VALPKKLFPATWQKIRLKTAFFNFTLAFFKESFYIP